MRRRLGLLLVLALLGAGWFARDRIVLGLYARGAERAMAANRLESLPDGLHAAFCGTGSPLPDPDRAGPCLAVIAGKRLIVVDAGEGAARNLALMGLPAARIERVLLTHFHSDHIDGLGALALQHWVQGAATEPLIMQGPHGVERIAAGFNAAYAIDSGYRTGHHGAAVAPPSGFGFAALPFALPEGPAVILDEGGLRVTAVPVDHGPVEPALAYRFDYKGRCVTVSGDTVQSAALERLARGCDLLVHEALQPRLTRVLGAAAGRAGNPGLSKVMADIENYHSAPELAAETAAKARVTALALTHIVPPLRLPGLDRAFLGDARSRFEGRLWIAADREIVSLPVGGGMAVEQVGGMP